MPLHTQFSSCFSPDRPPSSGIGSEIHFATRVVEDTEAEPSESVCVQTVKHDPDSHHLPPDFLDIQCQIIIWPLRYHRTQVRYPWFRPTVQARPPRSSRCRRQSSHARADWSASVPYGGASANGTSSAHNHPIVAMTGSIESDLVRVSLELIKQQRVQVGPEPFRGIEIAVVSHELEIRTCSMVPLNRQVVLPVTVRVASDAEGHGRGSNGTAGSGNLPTSRSRRATDVRRLGRLRHGHASR